MTEVHPGSAFSVLDGVLMVVLRHSAKGPVLATERVTAVDLAQPISELWLEGCLRKGTPEVPLEELSVKLLPKVSAEGGVRCVGYGLEMTNPKGETTRREFSVRSLHPAAARAITRLVDAQPGIKGDQLLFEVQLDDPGTGQAMAPAGVALEATIRRAPLGFLKTPIQPLLEKAEPIALLDDETFPIFYTAEAYRQAERWARRGTRQQPPIETGSLLAGSLCACPSGEFFAVITDTLEVVAAQQTTFSINFTDVSWNRIQKIFQAMADARPECKLRLLGNAHGHPFLPGSQLCDDCPKRPDCRLTSAYASLPDENWTFAVFHQQPWAINHVHGLSPRREPMNACYGLKDGILQPRGYYIIPEFSPEL